MQRAGLDTEKLMLCQPDSGEMALEVVDQTVRSSAVDIICVDSVAALVPRAEIEGEMGAHQGETYHMLLVEWLCPAGHDCDSLVWAVAAAVVVMGKTAS